MDLGSSGGPGPRPDAAARGEPEPVPGSGGGRLGHGDVGTDPVQRVQHRALGVLDAGGGGGHRDHQPNADGEAEGDEGRLPDPAAQLTSQICEKHRDSSGNAHLGVRADAARVPVQVACSELPVQPLLCSKAPPGRRDIAPAAVRARLILAAVPEQSLRRICKVPGNSGPGRSRGQDRQEARPAARRARRAGLGQEAGNLRCSAWPAATRAATTWWPAPRTARNRSAPCSWRTAGPCPGRRSPSPWSR